MTTPNMLAVQEALRKTRLLLIVVCLFALAACAVHKPISPGLGAATGEALSHDIGLPALPEMFQIQASEPLQQYLTEVEANNKNLQALMRSAQAYALLSGSVAAEKKLHIDADISAARKNQNENTSRSDDTVALAVQAKWGGDIWQKITDEQAAAQLTAEREDLTFQHGKQLILSQAIQSWFLYASLTRQIDTALQIKMLHYDLMEQTQSCYQGGNCPYDVYEESKNQFLHVSQTVSDLQQSQRSAHYRLNVLRGQEPLTEMAQVDTDYHRYLPAIAPIIPASALQDRPDILAAFKKVEGLDFQTRAAYKALLPQLNLTGTFSKISDNFHQSFGQPILWQLVGGVAQPLLTGDRLRLQARQKSKEAESAFFEYEAIVLTALEEVENALSQERTLAEKVKRQNTALEQAKKLEQSYASQYQKGLVRLEVYFQVKKQKLEAQNAAEDLILNFAQNRVQLALTLGTPFYMQES